MPTDPTATARAARPPCPTCGGPTAALALAPTGYRVRGCLACGALALLEPEPELPTLIVIITDGAPDFREPTGPATDNPTLN